MLRICVILACAPSLCAASVPTAIAELEPNNSKATATLALCLQAGDTLTGVTTGSSTVPLDVTTLSADYYRIRTCALPPGVYRHRLTLTTAGASGHQLTILGLDALDQPPPTITSTEVALEYSIAASTPPSFVQWYGFGRSEELYVRVTGAPLTIAPYQLTLSTVTVAPATIPNVLLAGQITITTEGQGHSTDTELKVYDANFVPIPGYANDDTPLALPGGGSQFQSTLQRGYGPGTYYLLLSRFNMANEQLPGPDDAYQNGDVLDFPDLVLSSDTTLGGSNVSFAVTDAAGTTALAAAVPPAPYEILWYQITIGQAWSITTYCFGDAGGFGCPCANNGLFGRGCANSVNTFGAQLAGVGLPSLSADSFALQGSGMPNGFVMYFQGTTQTQLHYGDGILCVGGTIIRLGLKSNSGGASQYPTGPDPLVSVQGLVVPGLPFRYQGWYRDSAAYCLPATFNLTNAVNTHWAP
jgi:hypothetical protein